MRVVFYKTWYDAVWREGYLGGPFQGALLNNQAMRQIYYKRKFIWKLEEGIESKKGGEQRKTEREERGREKEGKRAAGHVRNREMGRGSRWKGGGRS